MKKFIGVALISVMTAVMAKTQTSAPGRSDQMILDAVNKVVQDRSDCKNVRVAVEDAMVTLRGTVALESSRADIERRVRRVPHVVRVLNQIVLDPPAVPDNVLYGRLRTRLTDAGFAEMRFTVHNGRVFLNGIVSNRRDLSRLLGVVRMTEGVKEVDQTNFSTASY